MLVMFGSGRKVEDTALETWISGEVQEKSGHVKGRLQLFSSGKVFL